MNDFSQKYLSAVILLVAIFFSIPYAISGEDKPVSKLKVLGVGYSSRALSGLDLKDAQVAINVWAKSLSKKMKTGYKPAMFIFHDLDSMVKSIKNAKIDFVQMLSLDYLELQDKVSLEPAYVSVFGNKVTERYLLLVNKNNRIKQLSQLRNKKLIIVRNSEDKISFIWLNTLLMKENLSESENFFSHIKSVEKASQAVLPVFFRQEDVCIVKESAFRTMVELNPQVGKEITVIKKSPDFIISLFLSRKGCDKEAKKVVDEAVLRFHDEPEGKQMLMLFRADKIVPFQSYYLDNVKQLLKEYKELKSKK